MLLYVMGGVVTGGAPLTGLRRLRRAVCLAVSEGRMRML